MSGPGALSCCLCVFNQFYLCVTVVRSRRDASHSATTDIMFLMGYGVVEDQGGFAILPCFTALSLWCCVSQEGLRV